MADQNTSDVLIQDGTKPQDNAEELAAAAAVQAGEVDPQANADLVDDEIEKGKRLGGWQRKIKKLQEHNEILIEALRKGGGNAQAQQTQAVQEDKPPVKPKIADFTGTDAWEKYEEAKDKYFEDLTDFKSKKAVDSYRAETQQRSHQQTIQDGFAAQCAEAKKEFADFESVAFSEETLMSDAMRDAIVTSDFGARIAYELGKNPDEAERIANLNPVAAIREIGKIESRISSTKPAAEDDKEDPPAASSAPRPPTPVRRATAPQRGLRDDMPYKDWLKEREAELKRK